MSSLKKIPRWLRPILFIAATVGFLGFGFSLAAIMYFGPTIGPDDLENLKANLTQLDNAKAQWAKIHGSGHSAPIVVEDIASFLNKSRMPARAFGETYHLGYLQQPSVAVVTRRVEYHNNGHTPEFALFPKGTVFRMSDGRLAWIVPVGSTEGSR